MDPVFTPPELELGHHKVVKGHPELALECPELVWARGPRCPTLLSCLQRNLYLQRHLPPQWPPKAW